MVQIRVSFVPSEFVKRSSKVPVSPTHVHVISTNMRLVILPERSWIVPQPSTLPLKYSRRSKGGFSAAYSFTETEPQDVRRRNAKQASSARIIGLSRGRSPRAP